MENANNCCIILQFDSFCMWKLSDSFAPNSNAFIISRKAAPLVIASLLCCSITRLKLKLRTQSASKRQGFLIKFSCLPAVPAKICTRDDGMDENPTGIVSHHTIAFGRDFTFTPFSFSPSLRPSAKHFICCGRFCCKHERKLPVKKQRRNKKKRESKRREREIGRETPSRGSASQIHHRGDQQRRLRQSEMGKNKTI